MAPFSKAQVALRRRVCSSLPGRIKRHRSKQTGFIKNMNDLLEVNSSRRADAPVGNRKLPAPMGSQLPAPIESNEEENAIDKRWKGCVLFHPHAGELCNIDRCQKKKKKKGCLLLFTH